MSFTRRKAYRAGKYVIAGFLIYFVAWVTVVTERNVISVATRDGESYGSQGALSNYSETSMSTMKTIIAYSEGKQAEMNRPLPVTCEGRVAFPIVRHVDRTWTPGNAFAHDDDLWQTVPGTDVRLYSAYYDDRISGQPYVRILAMFEGRRWENRSSLYCQTRPSNENVSTVEAVFANPREIWWHEWDFNSNSVFTPLLFTCALTQELAEPSLVSVVTETCGKPENAFLLNAKTTDSYERNFTICVKDMNYEENISENLIEWIEINRIIGADLIDMYISKVPEEMFNLLSYYKNDGTVRLFRAPIAASNRSLWQRRRDHILTYNDCLYRNIRQSKYIIPIDVDEIILPKVAKNWHELILRLGNQGWDSKLYSAIVIRNIFFFDFFQHDSSMTVDNFLDSTTYEKRDAVRIDKSASLDKVSGINVNKDDVNANLLSRIIKSFSQKGKTLVDNDNIEGDIAPSTDGSACGLDIFVPRVVKHLYRSDIVSPVGHYSKSIMVTNQVLTVFNHYPLSTIGASMFGGWPAPFPEVQLNHYKSSCNATLVPECAQYAARRTRDAHAARLAGPLARRVRRVLCRLRRDAVVQ